MGWALAHCMYAIVFPKIIIITDIYKPINDKNPGAR